MNILLIISDDLNAWIGALGRHPQAFTPNIDTLAKRGALFINAYCSAPYCNASRMGLFTGQLPSTLGVYANEPFWDAPERPETFMEILRKHGYYIFGAGKVFHGIFDYERAGSDGGSAAHWIEVQNRKEVWDEFVTNVSEPLPQHRPMNRLFDFSNFAGVPAVYHHFDWGALPDDVPETSLPDVKVTEAVEKFLRAPRRTPFFCAAGLYKPHLPWHAPRRFFDHFGNHNIVLPLVKSNDLDDIPPMGRVWASDPPDHHLVTSRGVWQDAVRAYLACISYADELVGRIISALDTSPARDETAIVLCGDNGFHLGEKLHWRKFALWEEATRVPLIIVPPGSRQASRPADPVSLIDVFPTILQFAGLNGRSCDGVSLYDRMMGDAKAAIHQAPIMTWGKGNHSIRDGRWRYTTYNDGGEELYDHAADPHEWTNLAANPLEKDQMERLHSEIRRRCKRG